MSISRLMQQAASGRSTGVEGAWDLSFAYYDPPEVTNWDLSTVSLSQNVSVQGADNSPQGMFFKPDGTKVYVIGQQNDSVYEYDVNTAWDITTIEPTPDAANAWDISTATYSQSFSIAAQETSPAGVFFKPDGTKMYVLGLTGDNVNEYDLSTAWGISTASFLQSFSVSAQDTTPHDVFFKSDGTKMYVLGQTGQDVNEYDLSTAWDVSSASFLQNFSVAAEESQPTGLSFKPDGTKMYVIGTSGDDVNEYDLGVEAFDVSGQDSEPQGAFFKPDGTKLYIVGRSGDAVYEYDLSTAWDLFSASYLQSFSVAAQEAVPTDVFFKPDGTKMYVVGQAGDDVNEYDLSTAWDISTASYSQNFDVSAQETNPTDLVFKSDGTKMYVTGISSDDVNEYDLSTAWDISTASYSQNFDVSPRETLPTGVFFKPDGTQMYVIGDSGDDVNQYTLAVESFSVTAQEAAPRGVFFKSDGTKMYVTGSTGDAVHEYDLSTAWDLFSVSFLQSFSVAAQELNPAGVFFKSDGTKMYVTGLSGDDVNEYDLSTAWDVSTASFLQNFSVAAQETNPTEVFFKPDGTKMYIAGYTGDDVNEYDLSTAWDISTASFLQNFSVAGQDTQPAGLFFKPDGTKMYVAGVIGDDINEYDLSTAWDISTASFLQNFSVAAQETNPAGVFFKPDGTEMYVIGYGTDKVYKYDLSTAWDVSSASIARDPAKFWDVSTASFVRSFSVSAQETNPSDVLFSSDGTKMYVTGSSGGATYQYDLSTAWDVSTAAAVLNPSSLWDISTAVYSQSFSIAGQETLPESIFFKPDGTTMYIMGTTGDDVNEYALSTAWDVSTASFVQLFSVAGQDTQPQGLFFKPDGTKMYVLGLTGRTVDEFFIGSKSFSVSAQEPVPTDLFFKPDGAKMYVVGSGGDEVNEYDLGTYGFDVSAQETNPQGVFFKPDGTKMYVIGSTGDDVNEYDLSTAWDVFSASYLQNFNVNAQDTFPTDVSFKPDGTKMYVLGQSGDDVNEYDLSTAWNVSTASFLQNFSIAGQETSPYGVFFKPDGTKMYVVGQAGLDVNEYDLSTAWDVSTASFLQNFSVAGQDTQPFGVFFKSDGTKMYVIGATGDDVNEYDLSTAWDVSTASFLQNFSIAGQEASPQGVFFKPDGTKMYVIGSSGDAVTPYDLSTAWDISTAEVAPDPSSLWDISTASFVQNFSVAAQDTVPTGLFFKPDGTKMYVVGDSGNDVNEYDLSTAWNISTASFLQLFSVSGQETSPSGIFFKPDGSEMYISGDAGNDVTGYDLSTAWDISSASFAGTSGGLVATPRGVFFKPDGTKMYVVDESQDRIYEYNFGYFSVGAEETSPNDVFFKPDGTKMYVIGSAGDDVNEYGLANKDPFSVAAQDTFPIDVSFKPDGTKMYVLGLAGQDVNEYDLSTAWDISTASFLQNFSVSAQETSPYGLSFKPDGTKMYVIGNAGDDVNEYDLSTAWDISTASFLQNFSVSAQETSPYGVFFKPDGTKMYVIGSAGDDVNEYDLSTAWDISTASFLQNFSVAAQDITPTSVSFKPDGAKMYVIGITGDAVYEYDLSTAWDVSSASFLQNFSVSAQETSPYGLSFKPDGTKMYVIGSAGDDVNEYDLSTAWDVSTAGVAKDPAKFWDVSTASFVQNFSVSTQDVSPIGLFFKPDGTKMYVLGAVGEDVNEYDLSTAWNVSTSTHRRDPSSFWDISTASFIQDFSVAGQEAIPNDLFFKPDGTKMYVVGSNGDEVNEYNLSTAWDVSAASFVQLFNVGAQDTTPEGLFFKPDGSRMYVLGGTGRTVNEYSIGLKDFDVSPQETTPNGVFFKPDGTKMYVIGYTGDDVNEYDLSTAWSVSTASYLRNFSIAGQETFPNDVFFKPDGTKMYVIGFTGDDVNEYDLSTAWNVSTASYLRNFSVAGQDNSPNGVSFKPDGTKMYVIGSTGRDVNEYDLSTAWNVTTSSFVQNFSVAAQETAPTGLFFKSDGTKMYVLGDSGNDVNEYDLSTAWDISTASFLHSFSVSAQETSPQGIYLKPDGAEMYVVGLNSDKVTQYSLSTAWDVSTAEVAVDPEKLWDVSAASFVQSFNVGSQETQPKGVFFKPDGTKMYVTGLAGDDVNEYDLSIAWDVSSGSFLQNFSVTAQVTSPEDVFFKPDGTKMYVLGSNNDHIVEYNLSGTWDISSASYSQTFSVTTEETAPRGVFFKPDGSLMYIIGDTQQVHQYGLSNGAFDVSPQETSPSGVSFKPDGTKMYIVGRSGDAVYEYDLSTAWDVFSASYVQNFSVAAQDASPVSVSFKPDGTKMYVVGQAGDDVNEYDLSTAWDISTASFLQNFSVAAQDTTPVAVSFKPDGTKMYMVGQARDGIFSYTLGPQP